MNVLFLTTLPTLKACDSPYMQYYFKRFFVLHSSEVIFSFLIKKSRQRAIEIEFAFFHSLENPKGYTLDHFFHASHIGHNFPYKLIPISMRFVEIFLKLSVKTVQVHLIIWTTLKSCNSRHPWCIDLKLGETFQNGVIYIVLKFCPKGTEGKSQRLVNFCGEASLD